MTPLRVRVLGGLLVEGVEPARLGSRKQRRLLARLVLARGGVVSTDALADDVWGPSQPASPRDDLAVLVSRLRAALPGVQLSRRDGGYALTPAWLDLAELAETRDQAAALVADEQWSQAATIARQGLDLVRGPVLPEIAEAEWVLAEQVSADTSAHRLRLVLVRAELAGGDARVAADLAREAVGFSPYDEVALRLHLQACLAAGTPSLGITTYLSMQNRLAQELGMDPAPETVAAYEQLLRSTRPVVDVVQPSHARQSSPHSTVPPGLHSPDMHPTTTYVRTADGLYIAYQVTGSGPVDVLFNVGLMSHVEAAWEVPGNAQLFRRLSSFCRLIRFDKRGSGMSDPISGNATLEDRVEDMRAVLDAVGSQRTVLLGISEGGPMSILFSALHPGRTSAMVLFGTGARGSSVGDYPYGLPPAQAYELIDHVAARWGTTDTLLLRALAPSIADDPLAQQAFADFSRLAASPGQFAATTRMNVELDVRALLPSVQVPTLVLHRQDETFFEVGHARYLAEHIPGAVLKVLPGADHVPFVDPDQVVDEIEDFLLGARRTREPDRVLTTILMTDIVGSTEAVSALGDTAWREHLAHHDRLIRQQVQSFGGRELSTAGDSFVISFDGPAKAIRCAHSIANRVRAAGLQIRAGVHTGECEVRGDDFAGIALHIAARVVALAGPDEVLVSSTVRDLVAGSGIPFVERGEHVLKGIPEPWRVYAAGVG